MDAIAWMQIFETAALVFGAAIVLFLPWELWRLHRAGRLDRARVREMLASASPLLPTLLLGGVVTTFVARPVRRRRRAGAVVDPDQRLHRPLALLAVDFMYYWDHRMAHRNRTYWAISALGAPQFARLRPDHRPAGVVHRRLHLAVVLCAGGGDRLRPAAGRRLPRADHRLAAVAAHRSHRPPAVARRLAQHAVQPPRAPWRAGALPGRELRCDPDRLGSPVRHLGTRILDEPVRYGITHPIESTNPLEVHLCEAKRLWRDLAATPRWRDRVRRLLHAPDWHPDDPA